MLSTFQPAIHSVKRSKELSAILSTFIKLPFVIKTFVLSIFEWPLKTGFTVQYSLEIINWDPSVYTIDHPDFIGCSLMEYSMGLNSDQFLFCFR